MGKENKCSFIKWIQSFKKAAPVVAPQETKKPGNHDGALSFWTGGSRGSTLPVPDYKPTVIGKPTDTGNLFGQNVFGYNGASVGSDVPQPTEPLDGLFKGRVTVWPPPNEEAQENPPPDSVT